MKDGDLHQLLRSGMSSEADIEILVKTMVERKIFEIDEINYIISYCYTSRGYKCMIENMPYSQYPVNMFNYLCTYSDSKKNIIDCENADTNYTNLLAGLFKSGHPLSDYHLKMFEQSKDIKNLDPIDLLLYEFIKTNHSILNTSPVAVYIQLDDSNLFEMACKKFGYYPTEIDLLSSRASLNVNYTIRSIIEEGYKHRYYYFESDNEDDDY